MTPNTILRCFSFKMPISESPIRGTGTAAAAAVMNEEYADACVKYQNIACFSVSLITFVNTIWTNTYQTFHNFSIPFMLIYFTVDLWFTKKLELQIHHSLGLIGIAFKWIYNVRPEIDWPATRVLYNTERSSFFLVFKYVIDEYTKHRPKSKALTYLKRANNAIFFVTFFKYRIYDYSTLIITNPIHYDAMSIYTHNSWFRYVFMNSTFYGLYALNLYWFIIMIKILYKNTIRQAISIKTAILTEQNFTSFTYVANLAAATSVYSKFPNKSYLFDIFGIAALSITSYKYHSEVSRSYNKTNKLEYTSDEIIGPFIVDNVFIHMRSFLCSASAIYYSENKLYLYVSAVAHIGSFSAFVSYIYNLKRNNITIVYDSSNDAYKAFMSNCNAMALLPSAIDCCIITFHSISEIAIIEMLFALYLCGLILFMRPGYELNHLVFHIGVIFHTIGLSKCNLRITS